MLDHTGFDLWADGYDKSVGLSDESGTYPFAGYRKVLNRIYNGVLSGNGKTVLDIGFGTGTLTTKLYDWGCMIYGQDFSQRMIDLAKAKMPQAHLYQGNFSVGLVDALKRQRYDAIIATYSMHHLSDEDKAAFLKELLPLLNDGGTIYIGDVAFQTREELNACRKQAGDEWDDDEIYFVYNELKAVFPNLFFEPCSDCAGVLMLPKPDR